MIGISSWCMDSRVIRDDAAFDAALGEPESAKHTRRALFGGLETSSGIPAGAEVGRFLRRRLVKGADFGSACIGAERRLSVFGVT